MKKNQYPSSGNPQYNITPQEQQIYGFEQHSQANTHIPIVEGVPLYKDYTDAKDRNAQKKLQKFVNQGFQDAWAAMLFLLSIMVTVGLAIHFWPTSSKLFNNHIHMSKNTHSIHPIEYTNSTLIILPIVMIIVGLGLAIFALSLLSKFTETFIIGCNVMNILLLVLLGLFTISQHGSMLGSILLFIGAGLNALWLYLVRDHIPFSAILLKMSVRIIQRYKNTITTSIFCTFFSVGFCLITLSLQIPFIHYTNNAYRSRNTHSDSLHESNSHMGLFIFSVFMIYWFSQVIMNILHVTVSGLVATWYFVGFNSMPLNPTKASFMRAITTSLGSICLGSLLVAIIQTIRFMINFFRDNENEFVTCIVDCIISMIESMLEYFNKYAYTYIAIYGLKYTEAASRTWNLVQTCGFKAYFNDCLIEPTLTITTIGISFISALLAYFITSDIYITVLTGIIVLFSTSTVFQCVACAVPTLFVCTAEEPDILAELDPELYNTIMQANNIV